MVEVIEVVGIGRLFVGVLVGDVWKVYGYVGFVVVRELYGFEC